MFARASSLAAFALLAGLPVLADEVRCQSDEEPRRIRPGQPLQERENCDPDGLWPAIGGELPPLVEMRDRWSVVDVLGYESNPLNPYAGNNVLKGDRPAFGKDWFASLALVSDSTFESREIPTPVAIATAPNPDSLDVLGDPQQSLFTQNLLLETVLYKGDTVFRPPDYELRFTPVFNWTRVSVGEAGVMKVDPTSGTRRNDNFIGIQALFFDKHLRNVSDRYDFDSVRVGVQPITADFRGFLFLDSPVGIRLFGTRDNNLWQYNIGWFRRLEKDTNSGLNDISSLRDDDVFLFNLYRQDFPRMGFTSQVVVAHNRNREVMAFVDDNGFVVRPAALGIQQNREYEVTYFGLNGDGHFGRWNVTASLYYAIGEETPATFSNLKSDIRAGFAAVEVSRDFDWLRLRGTLIYASGDKDPYDDRSTGYDAIFENPLIAGADSSFWIRQAVPLIGGGRATLSGVNGLLNSLRFNKGQSQSNFSNPGILLAGVGADLELTPKLRLAFNVNQLWFDDTAVLEAARNQGGIDRVIGQDLSASVIYRPLVSQNIVMRLSAATLLPGAGYKRLYDDAIPVSVFANLVFSY